MHTHTYIYIYTKTWVCEFCLMFYISERDIIKENKIYMNICTYIHIYVYIYIHNYTHILHIIHNTNTTWAHTTRAHTTYNNASHVHVECVCVYKCKSLHVLCIERKIGPTNSYSIWASAEMIGQGAQHESPTPYTSQRGWPNLGTWLDTSDSWQKRLEL